MNGHHLSGKGPDFFTISYVQARPVALVKDIPNTVKVLVGAGFQECTLDYFYDMQLTRRNHIARLQLDNVRLTVPAEDGSIFEVAGELHILLWSVGFMVLRLTFNDTGMERPVDGFESWFKKMHGLEHDLFLQPASDRDPTWTADFAGDSFTAQGGARRFFDLIANATHVLLQGRKVNYAALESWTTNFESAGSRAEHLVERGELRFPHPTTFGSYSEMIWESSRTLPRHPASWICELMGSGAEGERVATDIDEHLDDKWWYLSEFQSIFVRTGARPELCSSVYDVSRACMIEYVAYRRAGLMSIQRETQAIAAERRAVEGARVADWMWLSSALTNDYVLGGWSAQLFERLRRKFLGFEGLRNIFSLEAQVSSNIEAFQGRLDAESDRMGVVTGVLFGIVAATALVPLGELLVIFGFHLRKASYSNFPNNYPLAFLGIIIVMIGAVGFVSWWLLRRAHSLRPPGLGVEGIFRRVWRRRF